MVGGADDISHAADVGMIDQTDNGSLASGADFLGAVGAFSFPGAAMMLLGRQSRYDFNSGLD